MVFTLMLNNYRKCRLWVNEDGILPDVKGGNAKEIIFPASEKEVKDNFHIVFELSLPRNNSNYAMIGFEFRRNDTCNTKITIITIKEQLRYFQQSLAKPNDSVFIGISEEYEQCILDSVIEALKEKGGYAPGELLINTGAYADIGSSKLIFAQAAKILFKISLLDLSNLTEADILKEVFVIL